MGTYHTASITKLFISILHSRLGVRKHAHIETSKESSNRILHLSDLSDTVPRFGIPPTSETKRSRLPSRHRWDRKKIRGRARSPISDAQRPTAPRRLEARGKLLFAEAPGKAPLPETNRGTDRDSRCLGATAADLRPDLQAASIGATNTSSSQQFPIIKNWGVEG